MNDENEAAVFARRGTGIGPVVLRRVGRRTLVDAMREPGQVPGRSTTNPKRRVLAHKARQADQGCRPRWRYSAPITCRRQKHRAICGGPSQRVSSILILR